MCAQSFSCVQLFAIPQTAVSQAPLSMEFSRQEYWTGLLFPPPGHLPNPGIKPASPVSPALAGRFFTTRSPGKPSWEYSLSERKKVIGTSEGEKRAQCREGEIQETGKARNSQDNSYSTWGQSWAKQVEPRMRTNGWRLQQPRPVENLPPWSILETQCSCFKQLPLLNLNHYVRKIELQSVP